MLKQITKSVLTCGLVWGCFLGLGNSLAVAQNSSQLGWNWPSTKLKVIGSCKSYFDAKLQQIKDIPKDKTCVFDLSTRNNKGAEAYAGVTVYITGPSKYYSYTQLASVVTDAIGKSVFAVSVPKGAKGRTLNAYATFTSYRYPDPNVHSNKTPLCQAFDNILAANQACGTTADCSQRLSTGGCWGSYYTLNRWARVNDLKALGEKWQCIAKGGGCYIGDPISYYNYNYYYGTGTVCAGGFCRNKQSKWIIGIM